MGYGDGFKIFGNKKMDTRSKISLTSLLIAMLNNSAFAQVDNEPGFFSEVDVELANDDNIYRVIDELASSDTYISIKPELQVVGAVGKQRFAVSYSGDFAKYSDYKEADYSDHDLQGQINLEHTLRFSTNFAAGYKRDHEEPGSINRIQLDLQEYNQFKQNFILAGISYGRENAIGKLSLDYRKTNKDYINNGLDFLDFEADSLTARFTYRVAPKTNVYIEGIQSQYDYEPASTFELDNDYQRVELGIEWDFTNKLTGDVSVGYQKRDYDLDTAQDIDGLAYNGEIAWEINSYTVMAAEARREAVDSSLEEAGGFLRTTYSLSLGHEFTELVKLTTNLGYSKDELVFSSNRQDKQYALEVKLDYELLHNLTVGASYTYEERDSTLATADYKANIVALMLKLYLGK